MGELHAIVAQTQRREASSQRTFVSNLAANVFTDSEHDPTGQNHSDRRCHGKFHQHDQWQKYAQTDAGSQYFAELCDQIVDGGALPSAHGSNPNEHKEQHHQGHKNGVEIRRADADEIIRNRLIYHGKQSAEEDRGSGHHQNYIIR